VCEASTIATLTRRQSSGSTRRGKRWCWERASISLDESSYFSLCRPGLALKLLGLVIVSWGGGGLVGLDGRGVRNGGREVRVPASKESVREGHTHVRIKGRSRE